MDNIFAAVIVTFEPNIERLKGNILTLENQGFSVVVVDNHSDNVAELRNAMKADKLIELSRNKGIAVALNIGMKWAKEYGATWVLTSDQDTEIDAGMLCEYRKYLILKDIGALCPAIRKRGEKIEIVEKKETEKVNKCPTSGFLISMEAWENVGEYDEWMFIDYVDYDMCMRLNIAGFNIYRVNTTYIIQELGSLEINKVLHSIGRLLRWKRLMNLSTTYNHSPLRNYYFVRNSLFYIDKYREHLKVTEEYKHLFKWEAKKLLLERNKIKNAKSIIKGICDNKKRKYKGK